MGAVLAVLEQRSGKVRRVSLEVLTAARKLADAAGTGVDAGAAAADPDARLGIRHALHTHRDLHEYAGIPVMASPRMRVCMSCVPS